MWGRIYLPLWIEISTMYSCQTKEANLRPLSPTLLHLAPELVVQLDQPPSKINTTFADMNFLQMFSETILDESKPSSWCLKNSSAINDLKESKNTDIDSIGHQPNLFPCISLSWCVGPDISISPFAWNTTSSFISSLKIILQKNTYFSALTLDCIIDFFFLHCITTRGPILLQPKETDFRQYFRIRTT